MKAFLRSGGARTALAVALVSGAASQVSAQVSGETAASATDDTTIVITGSYIRGTPEDAAIPVDVFSSEDLEKSGIESPLEFIKQLPTVGSVLGETNQFAAGASQGVGSLNLRSLGSTRSLVLMNGRRTITTPGGTTVNTQLMPMFALDRIEVLTDGAASTYGSDAIAGVANFILRRNFDGVAVGGQYSFIDGSDDDYQADILFGKNFEGGNFMIGFGWQHRSELPSVERDFTRLPQTVNPAGYSVIGNPATYYPRIGTTFLGGPVVDGANLDACEATGGFLGSTAATATAPPVCRFTYIPFDNLVEDTDRYQAVAQLDVDLTDQLHFHTDAVWARSELLEYSSSPAYPTVQGLNGPGSTFQFSVPTSNPYVADFVAQSYPGGIPAAAPGFPITNYVMLLTRPFGNQGNPLDPRGSNDNNSAIDDAFRISSGFEYEFSDTLRAELYGTYIYSTRTQRVSDVLTERYQNALNGFGGEGCDPATGTAGVGACMYLNPFISSSPSNPALGLDNPAYIPGNENDPELVAWLFEDTGTNQNDERFVVDLVFSGETGLEFAGGPPVAFAVGAQYRDTSYNIRPVNTFTNVEQTPCPRIGDTTCALPTGPFIFLSTQRPVALDQNVYAVFAEVNVPIGDRFELTGAVRYEDYGNPVGATTNPKGSFRWEATDFLTLRGSIGTSFRGPGPGLLTNTGPTILAGLNAVGNNFKPIDSVGNPNLRPESALSYNIGAIVDVGGFTFSADYWTYEVEDQFDATPTQDILNTFFGINDPVNPQPTNGDAEADCSSPFRSFVVFDNNDTCTQGVTTANNLVRARQQTVNGPKLVTRGIDLAFDYITDLGAGTLEIGALASLTLEYQQDAFIVGGIEAAEAFDAVGFANFDRGVGLLPDWKGNAWINWNSGNGLNLRWQMQYIDGVFDDRCPPDGACEQADDGNRGLVDTDFGRNIDSYMQHDAVVSYTVPLAGVDVRLTGAVENIFDEDPAAARLELGYTPFVGNPLGRVYRLGIKATY